MARAAAPRPRIRPGAASPAEPVLGPRFARTRGRVRPSPRARGEDRGEEHSKQVCVGVITGPHGVGGAVRIKSFTMPPQNVAVYGPLADQSGARRLELRLVGAAKGVLIGRFAGIDSRNQAEALRGLHLYLPRAALPAPATDEYYHADLIGLEAVLAGGAPIGRVRAIHDFGAGDTLEIERNGAPPAMVPFTHAIVPVVELEAGRLVVEPPPGLLDHAETAAPRHVEGDT